MADFELSSRDELDELLKKSGQHKKTKTKERCRNCGEGWHFKIRGVWSRCNKCGYSGYSIDGR